MGSGARCSRSHNQVVVGVLASAVFVLLAEWCRGLTQPLDEGVLQWLAARRSDRLNEDMLSSPPWDPACHS
jgi:hypothetical protein